MGWQTPPMEDWKELGDQTTFEDHVRAYTAAEYGAKALCVLDLGRHNALNFHTGSLDILQSDIKRTLPVRTGGPRAVASRHDAIVAVV